MIRNAKISLTVFFGLTNLSSHDRAPVMMGLQSPLEPKINQYK